MNIPPNDIDAPADRRLRTLRRARRRRRRRRDGGGRRRDPAAGQSRSPPRSTTRSRRPKPTGITARVHFTNNLISSGALPVGSPLLTGASGRLWLSGGRVRLELQSDAGDAQITVARRARLGLRRLEQHRLHGAGRPAKTRPLRHGAAHTACRRTDEISSALTQLAEHATLSGADPTTQAGQPAYKVSVTPKHDAGLLGQAEVAWDAANGDPAAHLDRGRRQQLARARARRHRHQLRQRRPQRARDHAPGRREGRRPRLASGTARTRAARRVTPRRRD